MKKVLVGGVFNIVHQGHEYFLKEAKKHGDFLVVIVATDKTAKSTKNYPVKPAEERKKALKKLGLADKVVVGDESDFMKTVEKEKPDLIVLGYDQKMSERELKKMLKRRGIKCDVTRLKKKLKGYSTKKLIEEERGI